MDVNSCQSCARHGFQKVLMSVEHRNSCPFMTCKCQMCDSGHHSSDRTHTSGHSKSNDHNLSADIADNLSFGEPLDAVRRLTKQLTSEGISADDLQTCALYLLMKNNDFSIDKTINQLCQSRTAIAECLVMSAFAENKPSENPTSSPPKETNETIPQISSPRPKRLKKRNQKAKKTFSSSSTKACDSQTEYKSRQFSPKNNLIPTNDNHSDISVQTKEPKTSKRKISDGLTKVINISEEPIPSASPLPKSDETPESLTTTITPIEPSVIPSTSSPSIAPINDSNTTRSAHKTTRKSSKLSLKRFNSCVEPTPKQISLLDDSSQEVPSISSSVRALTPIALSSLNSCSPSHSVPPFYSPYYKKIRVLTKLTEPDQCLKDTVENDSEQISPKSVISQTNGVNGAPLTSLTPHSTTSKDLMEKSCASSVSSTEGKLCAKIITTEAALVALSAFSDTNSSVGTSNRAEDTQQEQQEEQNSSSLNVEPSIERSSEPVKETIGHNVSNESDEKPLNSYQLAFIDFVKSLKHRSLYLPKGEVIDQSLNVAEEEYEVIQID